MRVLGIDPSLTSTGVATANGYTLMSWCIEPKNLRGLARLRYVRDAVMDWVAPHASLDLAVMEGPSFGSIGSGQHERGGLWWMLLHTLDANDIPVAIVPPTSRAKYATGAGNAGKDRVMVNVARRYAVPDDCNNDRADAVVLAAMGARHLGRPLETDLPKANLAAMVLPAPDPARGKLTGWPDLPCPLPEQRSSESLSA